MSNADNIRKRLLRKTMRIVVVAAAALVCAVVTTRGRRLAELIVQREISVRIQEGQ
jgi:hypothetical protein